MTVLIAPSDLWPGANDADVDRIVKKLSGRGFQVHPAPGRDPARQPEQRFSQVIALAQAYSEIREAETAEGAV